jgi:hypothetical protein
MSENKNKAAADGGQAAVSQKAPTTRKYLIPEWRWSSDGVCTGWWRREVWSVDELMWWIRDHVREYGGNVVVLNAVVPPASDAFMYYMPIDASTALKIIETMKPTSYVGHEDTAKLLGVQLNRSLYTPRLGDVAVVVRLRGRRPGGEVRGITLDDLEFALLWYL